MPVSRPIAIARDPKEGRRPLAAVPTRSRVHEQPRNSANTAGRDGAAFAGFARIRSVRELTEYRDGRI